MNQSLWQFAMVLLGILLFIVVLGPAAYLRSGITSRRKQLLSRVIRLAPLTGCCILGIAAFWVVLALSL